MAANVILLLFSGDSPGGKKSPKPFENEVFWVSGFL
jgi:hypothetical protein